MGVFNVVYADHGRGKGKLSPYLIKYHVMKACGGAEVQTHSFLSSALGGGDTVHPLVCLGN